MYQYWLLSEMDRKESYRKNLPKTQDHQGKTLIEEQQNSALKVVSERQEQDIYSISQQVEQLRQQFEKLSIK